MAPLVISINDTAKVLGVGRSSIYGLMKEGRLESIKIGRRTLLTTASINRLTQGNRLRLVGHTQP
jgi:excisionase family DNA binding protein